ncbi:MAG: hypothetical protein NT079_02980 [Candidatus Omnitrophica bacterium]|nr:hypothetical protein [Candidatus Omnitrophota bacterium]
MSIINDALKKVQQNLERHKKSVASNLSNPKPFSKKIFPGLPQTIIIASFLGSILILIIFFIFSPKQKPIIPAALAEKGKLVQSDTRQTSTPTPPIPRLLVPKKSGDQKNRVYGLTLNGIVKMDQEYVALINNNIVKEGESIGERKILKIDKDEVKIFDNGETIILRMNGF